jgi:hypothetical protein
MNPATAGTSLRERLRTACSAMTGKGFIPTVPEGGATAIGYVAAVLLFPLLVLWSQDNALFTGYGYIDPWVYFGYFRNLVEFKRNLFSGNAYGTHLSWILPGAALHTLFAPVTATFFLHLGVHTLATMSLFLTLKWVAGARRAFVATMVFSANPWLWAATGWDYVDGIGIAYCLVTMALLTSAARAPGSRWALTAAGMTLAALLNTGAGWLTLAPLLPLYYVGLKRVWHRTPFLHSFLAVFVWFGAGCVIATMGFGAVNHFLEGHPISYASSILEVLQRISARLPWLWVVIATTVIAAAVLLLVRRSLGRSVLAPALFLLLLLGVFAWTAHALILHGDNPWWEGLWQHEAPSPWLLFPMAAAATAAVVLFSERRRLGRGISVPVLLSLQLLCALTWMTYAQIRGNPELGQFHYASKLLPFSFLVIGARFWPEVEKVRSRDYVTFCCAAAVALGYAWLGEGMTLVADLPYAPWFGAAALLVSLLWVRFPEYLICSLAVFFVFTALGVGSRYGGIDAHAFRDQLQSLCRARERIEIVRQGRSVRFWYDDKDDAMPDAVALTATYLGEGSLLSRSFATPPCDTDLLPSTVVAAIATNASHGQDFVASALSGCWRGNGLRARPVETDTFRHGALGYEMALLRVEVSPGAWQAMVPVFDEGSRVFLRTLATSAMPPEFPNKYWVLQPADDTDASLRDSTNGIIVRTRARSNSVAALYPAMSVLMGGRYRFALRYLPGAGSFRLAVYDRTRADPWLASSSKGNWNGSDDEVACWVDLAAGQEFQLGLVNNSDVGRPLSFLIKGVTAVRIVSERTEAKDVARR